MKKLLMLIVMLVLVGSGQMQAQGLMGQLKDKAKKALINKAKKTAKNKAENAALDQLNKSDTGRKVLELIGDDESEGAVESSDAATGSTLLRKNLPVVTDSAKVDSLVRAAVKNEQKVLSDSILSK